MNKVSVILTFSLIILFIFIMYLALFSKHTNLSPSPIIGHEAPSFSLKTFDDRELSSISFNDKALVLNFWASWCVPCIEEVGVLIRASKKYQNEDIVFIAVNIWDDKENAVNFIKRYNADYPSGFDPSNEIQVNYGIEGVPETYFINKKGIIVDRFQGQLTDSIIGYFCSQILKEESDE